MTIGERRLLKGQGMGKPSAPQAPNPQQTAAAQTGSNVSTAIAQQQLNAVNQNGPNGSVTYDQNGTYDFTDPSTGQTYKLPKMTQNTTLSAGQQSIFDALQGTNQNLATTAQNQSAKLDGMLSQPFSLDNEATEGRLMELANKRLDPQLAQNREREIARLSNQGIKLGSTAYDRAITQIDQKENDARNNLMLTGRNQAVQEALLERQAPINELIALASGTQLSTPNPVASPQTGLAGTDVAGITQNGFNNQMGQYNQQMQQYNSTVGGLFGLGSSALMAFSDERLKENIEPTGEKVGGVPVKTWDWKDGGSGKGVIAQELERKHPELVDKSHPSGYRRVDYGGLMKLGRRAA
jgi:hypothetical protein